MAKVSCPHCGKTVDKLVEGMCVDCFLERHPPLPKEIEVLKCKHCGAVFVRGEWAREINFYKFMKREASVVGVETVEVPGGAKATLSILWSPRLDIPPRIAKYVVEVKYTPEVCSKCRELLSERELGLVQIRAVPRPIDDSHREKIFHIIRQEMFKYREKVGRINRIEEVKSGFDIYTNTVNFARHLAYVLHREFPSYLIESAKSMGARSGRRMYHVTYSLRIFTYRVGDLVKVRGVEGRVVDITKRYIEVEEVETKTFRNIPLVDILKGDVLLVE